jgi:predicted DNA-binding transcriptional regulator YafY
LKRLIVGLTERKLHSSVIRGLGWPRIEKGDAALHEVGCASRHHLESCVMVGRSARSQLSRLLRLIVALQASRYPNARRLADVCEVSRRTIYRDLELLEAAGLPVWYSPEHQGYQMAPGFAFPQAGLDEEEARALVVLCQGAAGTDGSGLHRKARDGAWKLVASLPPQTRERVQALAGLVQTRHETAAFTPERKEVYDSVLTALARRVQVRLVFCDRESLASSSTKVSPYRLVLDGPRWYLIGRSSLHRGPRVFALPWVERVELTEERAIIPPRFDLERFLGVASVFKRKRQDPISLRFSPRAAREARERQWDPNQRIEPREDGGLDMHLNLEGDELLSWILGFADQVEVLGPPELRDRVREVCRQMARVHESRDPTQAHLQESEPAHANDQSQCGGPGEVE